MIGLDRGAWIIGFLWKYVCGSSRRITLSDHFWQHEQAVKRALSQEDRQRRTKTVCVCLCGRSCPFSQGAACSSSSYVSSFLPHLKHIIAGCICALLAWTLCRFRTRLEFNHHLSLKDKSHIHTQDGGTISVSQVCQNLLLSSVVSLSFIPLARVYFLICVYSVSESVFCAVFGGWSECY